MKKDEKNDDNHTGLLPDTADMCVFFGVRMS